MGHALLNPDLSIDEARRVAGEIWGLDAEVDAVESNQDQNFLLRVTDGRRLVLKVASAGMARPAIDAQLDVLAALGGEFDGITAPVCVESATHRRVESVRGFDVFVLTWADGRPMNDPGELSDRALREFGRLAGRMVTALAGLDVPAADRVTQWDPARAAQVVAALSGQVGDLLPCGLAESVVARAEAALAPLAAALPRQVIHGDLTDFNVVGRADSAGRLVPCGVIDFGDVVHTWRVAELAVTATALVARSPGDPLRAVVEVTRGFNEVVPLHDAEVEAVWPAVLARAALLAVSDAQQVVVSPGNPYPVHALGVDRPILEAVAGVPDRVARAAVRMACGHPADPDAAGVAARLAALGRDPTVIGLPFPADHVAGYDPVDLTAASPDLGAGDWENDEALTALLHRPGRVVVARHGEARITFTRPDTSAETRTVHHGHDLFVAAGTPVIAPVAARVEAVAERTVWLRPDHPDLGDVVIRLLNLDADLAVGQSVGLGERVGQVTDLPRSAGTPAHVHVQVAIGVDRPAGAVTPRHAAAWRALSPPLWPEPSWTVPAPADPGAAAVARRRHVARAQKTYYPNRPIEIVRGWRHHLYDRDGRAYLDMVNNVAVVGHSHPRITAAAARQLATLNTNSRFLYPSLTRLADRLVATTPEPLDKVFLVNSGSEAVDLAVRLSRHATGHRGVIAIEGGYHGWTGSVTEFTSNRFDNPRFYADQPDHVAVVGSPDLYRGLHRDAPDPAAAYAHEVERATRRLAPHGVAAFVFEGLLGNQGGLELPDGYLAAACANVRSAGGLCIADEVQVGYGRTGDSWWAFEQHGVVPDIITVAKAMGNGHPVGAVITTDSIAESFAASFPFFSSVGGGPVSCEIALAVLDIIEDEGLQANAAAVGARLQRGLEEVRARHELVGAVHGRGLYLGIDLVADQVSRAPAVELADAVCDRMRDHGVVVQTTGNLGNIVKVKPPLCLTAGSADFFVEQLDRALGELR